MLPRPQTRNGLTRAFGEQDEIKTSNLGFKNAAIYIGRCGTLVELRLCYRSMRTLRRSHFKTPPLWATISSRLKTHLSVWNYEGIALCAYISSCPGGECMSLKCGFDLECMNKYYSRQLRSTKVLRCLFQCLFSNILYQKAPCSHSRISAASECYSVPYNTLGSCSRPVNTQESPAP